MTFNLELTAMISLAGAVFTSVVACNGPVEIAPKPQMSAVHAVEDTAAIKHAVATHMAVPDSLIAQELRIRKDTAWVWVEHDSITTTVVRVERVAGRWVFVREVLSSIR